MLVLTRKKNQSILIGDLIEVYVLDIEGDKVKIGINAPKNVPIVRREIKEIIEENKKALETPNIALEELSKLMKIQK